MSHANLSVADEVEAAIAAGSAEKCAETAERVTALFLASAGSYSDEQIELFGNVFERLVNTIELRAIADVSARIALAELSCQLAPVPQAPASIIRHLATARGYLRRRSGPDEIAEAEQRGSGRDREGERREASDRDCRPLVAAGDRDRRAAGAAVFQASAEGSSTIPARGSRRPALRLDPRAGAVRSRTRGCNRHQGGSAGRTARATRCAARRTR